MKLNISEKILRKDYIQQLLDIGGTMESDVLTGTTVVVAPALSYNNEYGAAGEDGENLFFYVAASYCSPEEKFRRKRGELVALERLFSGEFLAVPAYGRGVDQIMIDTMEFVGGC